MQPHKAAKTITIGVRGAQQENDVNNCKHQQQHNRTKYLSNSATLVSMMRHQPKSIDIMQNKQLGIIAQYTPSHANTHTHTHTHTLTHTHTYTY